MQGRGWADLLAAAVIIGAAQVVQGVGGGADLLAAHVERVQGEKKKPRAAVQGAGRGGRELSSAGRCCCPLSYIAM